MILGNYQVVLLSRPKDTLSKSLLTCMEPDTFRMYLIHKSISPDQIERLRLGPPLWLIIDANYIDEIQSPLFQIIDAIPSSKTIVIGGVNKMNKLLATAEIGIDFYLNKIAGAVRISKNIEAIFRASSRIDTEELKPKIHAKKKIHFKASHMADKTPESRANLEKIKIHKDCKQWWIKGIADGESILIAKEIASTMGRSVGRIYVNPKAPEELAQAPILLFTHTPPASILTIKDAVFIYAGESLIANETDGEPFQGHVLTLSMLSLRTLDKAEYIIRWLPLIEQINCAEGRALLPPLKTLIAILLDERIRSYSLLWERLESLSLLNGKWENEWSVSDVSKEVEVAKVTIENNYRKRIESILTSTDKALLQSETTFFLGK